jgi:hypothetical protein
MTQAYDIDSALAPNGQNKSFRDASNFDNDERPLSAIVLDLWEKTESLVRQEMRLGLAEAEEKVDVLKTELEAKLAALKVELAAKAVGGAVLFAGLLTLVAAVVLLLAQAVAPWVAALIVGVASSAGGFVLVRRTMRLPGAPEPNQFVPKRSIESLKRDAQTIREATK